MKKKLYFIITISIMMFSCNQELLYQGNGENYACKIQPVSTFEPSVSEDSNWEMFPTGDIRIEKSYFGFSGKKDVKCFEIEVPEENDYFFTLWIMPAVGAEYYMKCNDALIPGTFRPQKEGGWQSVYLLSEEGERLAIPLLKGRNTISFFSSLDEVPEIEFINAATEKERCFISSEPYEQMLKNMLEEDSYETEQQVISSTRSGVTSSLSLSPEDILFYQYALNCPMYYTTTKYVSCSEPTTLTIKISQAIQAVVVDVLDNNNAPITTRLCLPTSSVTFSVTVPAGSTKIHLRRWNHYPSCQATLTISKEGVYPISYTQCVVSGYNVQMDVPYFSGNLNYFAMCNTAGINPVMYLETGTTDPSPIGFQNDNYSSSGYFNWGYNPRIIANNLTNNIVETHVYNAQTSSVTATCDVYLGLPYYSFYSSFPNLTADDAILSGIYSTEYNCIGWAGDLLNYVWPPDPASPYYISNNPLVCFDNYFNLRGYTRSGANENNAAVALWGNSSTDLTHASIRNNSNSIYPHGYDWESKAGHSSCRLFHPKDALAGNLYGSILYYYAPSNAVYKQRANEIIESVVIKESDKEKLSFLLSNTPDSSYIKFNSLYKKWFDICHEAPLACVSNPQPLLQCTECKELKEYINENIDVSLPMVIEIVFEKDLLACHLLGSILPKKYEALKSTAYKRNTRESKEIATYEGNCIRLASLVLNQLSE